ncbi:MAG: hypothetical protein HY556_09385 [Euryarchaeota archaeon]|nr:hypothetical protein [Euryarchaeota archaeon]
MKHYKALRAPTRLDREVQEFAGILDLVGADYAVSGAYVASLFGAAAPRRTDFVVGRLKRGDFHLLWKKLSVEHDAKDAPTEESGYDEILMTGGTLTFTRRDAEKTEFGVEFDHSLVLRLTLRDHDTVERDGLPPLRVAPLELQIALDVSVGGPTREKAARSLYAATRREIDLSLLRRHLDRLGVSQKSFVEVVGEDEGTTA